MRKVLQTKLRYASVVFAVAVAVLLMPLTAQAIVINFDTGFSDQQEVTTAVQGATFGVGAGAMPTGNAFIAGVGLPQTAFVPNDTPVGVASGFFLTDEPNGPNLALNYFIDFNSFPVSSLSLDLYDYRVDGGPTFGDTATLTVYSDAGRTILVGTDTFTIPGTNPVDGNVETLSVSGPSIRAASLIFSGPDVGTGIDNISFSPVPEPSTLLLLGSGLFGVAFVGGGRRRRGKDL